MGGYTLKVKIKGLVKGRSRPHCGGVESVRPDAEGAAFDGRQRPHDLVHCGEVVTGKSTDLTKKRLAQGAQAGAW